VKVNQSLQYTLQLKIHNVLFYYHLRLYTLSVCKRGVIFYFVFYKGEKNRLGNNMLKLLLLFEYHMFLKKTCLPLLFSQGKKLKKICYQ
jgi:hypothetical protein